MTDQSTQPDLPSRKDTLAWVPLHLGGDIFLGLQEARLHMQKATECIQRVELLIGGFKSDSKQP
jgi:hypothetical protein